MRLIVVISLMVMASGAYGSTMACYASQTTVGKKAIESEATPEPKAVLTEDAEGEGEGVAETETSPAINVEDIPLEKSYVTESEDEVVQFSSSAFKEKKILISATLNSDGTSVSLLLRDLTTHVATSFSGALGKDASVVANLATSLEGEQKMISLTCHAAVATGNLHPQSPQNF